jgi:hypothetical protein
LLLEMRCHVLVVLVLLAVACGGCLGKAEERTPHGKVAFFLRGSDRLYLAMAPLEGGGTRLVRLPTKGDPGALEFSSDGATASFLVRPVRSLTLNGGAYYVIDLASFQVSRILSSRTLGSGVQTASRSSSGRVAVMHKIFAPHSSCRGKSWISGVERNGISHRLGAPPLVARQTAQRTIYIGAIAWAPDSRSIVYTVSRWDDPGDCRLNEYGSGFLFRTAANVKAKIVQLRHTPLFVGDPQWSPDRTLVAFDEGHLDRANIFLVRPHGHERRAATHFPPGREQALSYRWAGPASIVAVRELFDYDNPPRSQLYALDVRAGTARRVAEFSGSMSVHAVTKDGRFVILSSGAYDLVTVETADGAIRRRMTLRSPQLGLRLRENDPIAVSLAG